MNQGRAIEPIDALRLGDVEHPETSTVGGLGINVDVPSLRPRLAFTTLCVESSSSPFIRCATTTHETPINP
jgi:hypothetical protein